MDTKKTLGAVAIALALVGAGCAGTATQDATNTGSTSSADTAMSGETTKYKDFAAGMTLYYPKEWKSQKNDAGTGMVFLSPAEGSGDFQENVGFVKQDISMYPPVTLDEYTGIITEDTKKRLSNVTIVSTEKTTVGGMEAGVLTYTASYPNQDELLKVRHTYVLKDKTAYLLTYTAEESKFDTYLDAAKAVEASFVFDEVAQ